MEVAEDQKLCCFWKKKLAISSMEKRPVVLDRKTSVANQYHHSER